MSEQENRALMKRCCDATNRKDLDAFDAIFAPNFMNHAAGFAPIVGLEAMKALLSELLDAFPDWHVTIEDLFSEGDKVVVRWKLSATHLKSYKEIPATGKKIEAEGIHIDHIANGKVAKRWASNNFAAVFAELKES